MLCTDVARPTRGSLSIGLVLPLLVGSSGSAALGAASEADKSSMIISGLLTDEGVECQALRADSGELFTLIGELKGFRTGQRVRVSGELLALSYCQQGITLRIGTIVAA